MIKKLFYSLVGYFFLLPNTAAFSYDPHHTIVINHADIFLYLRNTCNYDLWDTSDGEVSDEKVRRQIRNELGACFSKIQIAKTACRSPQKLHRFLIEVGLKQEKELINTDSFLQRFAQLPKVKQEVEPFYVDIVRGIEEAVKSYFDDAHYKYRKFIGDRFVNYIPFIFIVLSFNENGEWQIFAAPQALQDFLYPDDMDDTIDYVSLGSSAHSQGSLWLKIIVIGTALSSFFIPTVQMKFPSIMASYGEQQMKQLQRESTLGSLGLSGDASQAEIKKACNNLYLQFHPDKNSDPNSTEKYQAVRAECASLLQKK